MRVDAREVKAAKGRWFFIVAGAFALVLILLAVAAPFAGDGDIERPLALEDAGADAVTFELEEVGDSGQFGFATLDPADGETRVALELGMPPGVPQPAHVHRGSCDNPSQEAVLELESLTLTNPRLTTSTTVVEAPLEELQQRNLVIDVHQSEDDESRVACGTIPRRE